MEQNNTTPRRKPTVYVFSLVVVCLLFAVASVAFALLNFNGPSIPASDPSAIIGKGVIDRINNARAFSAGKMPTTGFPIGRPGQVANFPGAFGTSKFSSLLIGTSTLPTDALFVIATSSNIITVLSNGSVGIGTATPDSNVALDVNGPVEAVANTGNGGPAFDAETNNAYDYAYYGTNQQHQWGELNDAGDLADLFNRQDGNGLYIDNMFYSPLPSEAVLKLLSRATSPVGDLILANSGAFPGTEKFAVDTNGGAYFAGNVGIGTTAPSATLQVGGASPTVLIGAGNIAGCLELMDSSGNGAINYLTATGGVLSATTTKPSICQ